MPKIEANVLVYNWYDDDACWMSETDAMHICATDPNAEIVGEDTPEYKSLSLLADRKERG